MKKFKEFLWFLVSFLVLGIVGIISLSVCYYSRIFILAY